MKKAIDAILSQAWAIQHEWLDMICKIAERESEFSGNLEALEAKLGRPLGNAERATVRNGVAIIPIEGPLFPKANLMTQYSGATSYQMLATDLQAAIDDPFVESIVLNINSPGGAVTGVSQLAEYVRDARGKKKITAFIGGTGASAAYWIASAADEIVASDTAIIGSIGVIMGMQKADQKPGVRDITFVSSNAPLKQADPETEAGAREYQRLVDDLESVFISTVAVNRGVDIEAVKAQYGQGAVFVAADALQRGMIDKIGSLEGLLTSFTSSEGNMDYKSLTAEALAENRPDLVASIKEAAIAGIDKQAIRAEGASAERERINAIEALAMPGHEELVAKFKADSTLTVDQFAVAMLKAAKDKPAAAPVPAAGAQHLQNLKVTEQNLIPPTAEGEGDNVAAKDTAESVIEAARKHGAIR